MPLIRLDRFISERTEYTRSTIKELAKKGKISVDGVIEKSSDRKIDPENCKVKINGRLISSQRYRYVLLNKPEGYVCSTDDKDGETVMKLVPEEWRTKNMFPAGRLDKDSLGVLLITDDGELAHKMLSPASHVPKIYIVKLDRPFQSKYIDIFKNGVVLPTGELCLPARLRPVENCDKLAFVELHEGKYHQIKRMFGAVGNSVGQLARISVGGLILPEKLAIGQCMELLHKDVENLFSAPDFDLICRNFSGFFRQFQ